MQKQNFEQSNRTMSQKMICGGQTTVPHHPLFAFLIKKKKNQKEGDGGRQPSDESPTRQEKKNH